MNNQKIAEGNWLEKGKPLRTLADLFGSAYTKTTDVLQQGADDTAGTIARVVKDPLQAPAVVNETVVQPVVQLASAVPSATKEMFSPGKTFQERSNAASKATMGVLAPLAILSPLTRGLVGKMPALAALAGATNAAAIEGIIQNSAQREGERKDYTKQLNQMIADSKKTPFEQEAERQNREYKNKELLRAFKISPSPEIQNWAEEQRQDIANKENKPSILKILKDHKGWIAGAAGATGGLVLGIAKNYMDKRKEAEDKKKQQRRLFLQSQYPLLHP